MVRIDHTVIVVLVLIALSIAFSGFSDDFDGLRPQFALKQPFEPPLLRLTMDSVDQQQPYIGGNRVVYYDNRTGNNDVYLYDLVTRTETRLTSSPSDQQSARISGNYVVWLDSNNLDIYLYNIATGALQQITNHPALQWQPDISGNYVVWLDHRSGVSEIYMYNIASGVEQALTSNGAYKISPTIEGPIVAWAEGVNLRDIVYHNLATGSTQQIVLPGSQERPDVSGTRIVFEDFAPGQASNVFFHDISIGTTAPVVTAPRPQTQPQIFGDVVVWTDNRWGNDNIFYKNLQTGVESYLTTHSSIQRWPAISGSKVVWFDERDGNREIYLADLGDSTPPAVSITSPPVGSTIPGTGQVTISASAADFPPSGGIASIRIFINPAFNPAPWKTCFFTAQPYVCTSNINANSNLWATGANIIRAEATDTAAPSNLGVGGITVYH